MNSGIKRVMAAASSSYKESHAYKGGRSSEESRPPRWNLASIYKDFDSPEYAADIELAGEGAQRLLAFLEPAFPESGQALAASVKKAVFLLEEASEITENLFSYAYAVYTTDTRAARPLAEINKLETLSLPLAKAVVLFRERLAERAEAIEGLIAKDGEVEGLAFFLRENVSGAAHQMPSDLEDLANDLGRSGGEAWSRLQEALSSTADAVWDEASGERKNVVALRALAYDADRAVRERAYRLELSAWKSVEIPMAAALNGVKGWYLSLNKRRAWDGALDQSLFQSRISKAALEALIGAIEESLPLFRRYLKAKARLLGVDACAFYDLFAPVGSAGGTFTYDQAAAFIVERFSAFDPSMGDFARYAFSSGWIDAETRDGKVGGAYCTGFPLKGESRILCNFEGSFSSLSTIAHELGHAWHHELLKDQREALRRYPMTLAETASIFAETVVFEGTLGLASDESRLSLIEDSLKDSCQVIVDILSRFYFERAVFSRRQEAELPAEEFCGLMLEAQRATYGDALASEALHPYMWAVKSHYYRTGLAFYNFPYAFGLLFGLGLYDRARLEGPSFAASYRELLGLTGRADAVSVAKTAGFDIETAAFWKRGFSVIASRVDEFEALTEKTVGIR